jgi:hypothetical protein
MIKSMSYKHNLSNYETINGCCGAHYLTDPLNQYQQFNGIAVADREVEDVLPIEPVVVKTKNGPMYVYLTEGTTP